MTFPDVRTLVPHRPPMLLIDSVIGRGERSIACSATIAPDSLFVEGGRADAVLCVELVAQSVAAYVGLRARDKGEEPQLGLLVSCREATFDVEYLASGDRLDITASHLWGDAEMGLFRGEVLREGKRLAAVEVGVVAGDLTRLGAFP